jgi:predicted O-methyltransferase YrrM
LVPPSEGDSTFTCDVAIVNYNTDLYLHNLLVSLRDTLPAGRVAAVYVWDNGSSDSTPSLLAAFAARAPWLRVHRAPANIHHGPALDRLLRRHCTAEWVLVLDADTEVRRDFGPHLPLRDHTRPAFVGQIHPQMPHLYAYLAHLMIHRPTYLGLPSFRNDGAPGDEYFRAIEKGQWPYERFRWCDYVAHAGQASLRAVHARSETTHPFYEFAAAQVQSSPASAERKAHEAQLRGRLAAFLGDDRPVPLPVTSAIAPEEHHLAGAGLARRSWRAGVLASWRAGVEAAADPRAAHAMYRARRVGLVQQTAEIRELFRRVRDVRPRRVLEIGTAYGGSLYLWTRASAPDARVISVDVPPWETDDPWEAQKLAQFRGFARPRQAIELIRADSHLPATLTAVRAALGGEPLDFLFIDGDQTDEGVRRDAADYGALLRPGGLMALHDIHPHSKARGGDVPRLWHELRATHRTEELVADRGQDGFGIGLVWV